MITNDALLQLRATGARVRRVNNIPHNKRYRYQVDKGAGDIQGYTSKGLHIEVEVKKIGDTLKPEQRDRLLDLKSVGGISIIATEQNGKTVLIDIYMFLKL